MFKSYYNSPIGIIEVSGTEEAIMSILFVEKVPEEFSSSSMTDNCKKELEQYFNGELKRFYSPLITDGTAFQKEVWKSLAEIPYGETSSYLQLAEKMNNVGATRAVGSTNGKNKILIVLPCHRIIGSDGNLTGYAGGLWRKKWLLEHEAKQSGKGQFVLQFA